MENYFGKNGFVWFIGVVEDRNDPEKMGRVRVRCLGHHTEDKIKIPTDHLSWSTVMAPTTTPSMDGLGSTPPFLVEGSWVTGFFLDGYNQESVIVGSLPGYNSRLTRDKWELTNKGFRDPNGAFPRSNDVDTSRLARGAASEAHDSLITRRANRITDIPKATKPKLSTVEDMQLDERALWEELHPKSNTYSQYPYNHVTESESGHVTEVDDTPGGERLMNYHRTGTFDEIHPDGSKVTKIVGSEYEITLQDKNVLIEGACNITISGACRQLIKGDYILEVEGNYTEKIHKNHYVKIGAGASGGNEAYEILGNRTGNINKNDNLRINQNTEIICNGNYNQNINGIYEQTYIGDYTITSFGSMSFTAKKNMSLTAINNDCTLKAGDKMNIRSTNSFDMHSDDANFVWTCATTTEFNIGTSLNLTSGTTQDYTAGGDITMQGGPNINLN
jgi:hypothetical protein